MSSRVRKVCLNRFRIQGLTRAIWGWLCTQWVCWFLPSSCSLLWQLPYSWEAPTMLCIGDVKCIISDVCLSAIWCWPSLNWRGMRSLELLALWSVNNLSFFYFKLLNNRVLFELSLFKLTINSIILFDFSFIYTIYLYKI